MGWAAAVPEKKGDKPFDRNKFLLNLVSGGAVAAIAKTALGGNAISVIRYAQPQSFNFAFKEHYKKYFGVDKNDPFLKFYVSNFQSGGTAGATTLCLFHPLETALAQPARNNESPVDRLIRTVNSREFFRGLFRSLPAAFAHGGFYFGFYDTMKVKVASDGQKLNFFAAWALAMGTTHFSEFISYLINLRFTKHPEHKEFYSNTEKMRENRRKILRSEGLSSKYLEEFWRCCKYWRDYDAKMLVKEGFSKPFLLRCVTGALVLAGFDEIQKWLH